MFNVLSAGGNLENTRIEIKKQYEGKNYTTKEEAYKAAINFAKEYADSCMEWEYPYIEERKEESMVSVWTVDMADEENVITYWVEEEP